MQDQGNELAISEPRESRAIASTSVFSGISQFEDAQRMAQALSRGEMIPKDYQNNIPNTLIAMEMANRIGMSPVAVMQNVYIIHGKPSWSSKFIIAAVNGCGRFSPLRFKIEGSAGNETCYAYATCKVSGDVLEGPKTGIAMAKAEGWMNKSGSKWKTMPDLMMRYRAATFFGNLYAPDILMGFGTTDESEDINNSKTRKSQAVDLDIPAPPPMKTANVVEEVYEELQPINVVQDRENV